MTRFVVSKDSKGRFLASKDSKDGSKATKTVASRAICNGVTCGSKGGFQAIVASRCSRAAMSTRRFRRCRTLCNAFLLEAALGGAALTLTGADNRLALQDRVGPGEETTET